MPAPAFRHGAENRPGPDHAEQPGKGTQPLQRPRQFRPDELLMGGFRGCCSLPGPGRLPSGRERGALPGGIGTGSERIACCRRFRSGGRVCGRGDCFRRLAGDGTDRGARGRTGRGRHVQGQPERKQPRGREPRQPQRTPPGRTPPLHFFFTSTRERYSAGRSRMASSPSQRRSPSMPRRSPYRIVASCSCSSRACRASLLR